MKIPEAAKNVLLLVCATGVCLVLAELLLGRYLPANRLVYQLDRACLYRLTPASHKVFRHFQVNGGHSIQVEINSLGLRGDELAGGEGGARRIVVYGDSFIEAEFSPLDQTFVGQLDRKLNEDRHGASAGPAVEVLNAGVIGYGPDQVAVRLQTELGSLKPDLVIVALCSGNDFGDLLRNKIYRLGEGGRLVDNAFVVGVAWSLGEIWLGLALGAVGGRLVNALVLYTDVYRRTGTGDVFEFRWWFEKSSASAVELYDPKAITTWLRSLGRRDTYVFVWAIACVAGFPYWVVGHAAGIAAVYLVLLLLQYTVFRNRRRT